MDMDMFLICVGNCFVNTINSVEKQLNLAGLSASRDEIKQFLEKNDNEIDAIRDAKVRYGSLKSRIKQKGGFEFKEFYKWYKKQEKSCYYCGTTEKVLKAHKIKSKKKSFTGTLHIDKKDPDKPYTSANCVLACALCNNAKSDMINAENFKTYFGEKMGEFITALHNDEISNK